MAWNFKNLHRMYPTANVYREGTASELDYALSDEIANFQVNTPSGKKSYREFLYSDDSTTMGMVILVLSI
jgi:hypothetical protein